MVSAEDLSTFTKSLCGRYPYLNDAPGVSPFDGDKLSAWALDRTIGSTRRAPEDVTPVWLILAIAESSGLYEEQDSLAREVRHAAVGRSDQYALLGLEPPADCQVNP